MNSVIEFISKLLICIFVTQGGKTYITIKNIFSKINEDDKDNLGRSIHIVLTMNTKLNNAQFATRLEEIENTYGKGSVCVHVSGKYIGNYTHVKKLVELKGLCLDKSTCPRVVVMCTNKTRTKNVVEFLNVIDKNDCCIKRAFVYYDEIHEYINNGTLRREIEEIHKLDIVQGITGFTATPFKTWTTNWSTPFWSSINIIKLGDFSTTNYVGYEDVDFHCIDDYFIEPYVRPSPFGDELDRQTIGFIENVLTKNPQILNDNTRSFIPAHRHRCGHNAVRDLIFRLNNKAVVVILNGVDKTLEYNNCNGMHITLDLSKDTDEVSKTISRLILENNLQNRPYVITGLLCVGMGQTLTHIDTGTFTSAIFGHMDLTNDQIYQLFGRITGRMKHWEDKYVRTQVYCPTTIQHRCKVMEVCAMNIMKEHDGDTITQADYMDPVDAMPEGKAIKENIRKEKKERNMSPKEDNMRTKANHRVPVNLFRVYKGEDEAVMRNVVYELYGRKYTREFKKSEDKRFLLSSITKKEQIVGLYTAINAVPGTAGLKHIAEGKPAPRRAWACYKDTNDNSTLYYIVLIEEKITVEDLQKIDAKYPNHITIPEEGDF
jgi:hypothetical protein